MSRPSIPLEGDPGYAQTVTAFEYERNKRDRDAIFAALRSHLVRPGTPAKVVVDLLRRHFLQTPALSVSDLSQSERAILIEILHKVLEEWSHWRSSSSSKYVSPPRLIQFYAQYRILGPQDWAFCLNSLAWTAYEAFFTQLDKTLDARLQRNVDTFLLLRALLKTWKLFFYCHSREARDNYELLNEEAPALWPILHRQYLSATVDDYSPTFSHRLLSFAPEWRSSGESFADQQLISACMVSIAALSESIDNSTSISILSPSTVINWQVATVSRFGSGGNVNKKAGPAYPLRSSVEHKILRSELSSDELSMLFIVGQALNSQSVNLTMLRVSLAKIVPDNRIGQIMMLFSQFRSRVPDLLLGRKTFDPCHRAELDAVHTPTSDVTTSYLTEPITRDPVNVLLEQVNASQSLSEVESVVHVLSIVRQRNPRLRLRNLEIAIYKKYVELGNAQQERKAWSASPLIHNDRELWASRLQFYFDRNDLSGFEDVWAGLIAADHAVSAGDWCKKLQLYFNSARLSTALEHFEALLRDSSRSRYRDSSAARLGERGPVTIDTFNLMIENLLKYDKLSRAMAVKQRLDQQYDIKANAVTYNIFFSYYTHCGNLGQAARYLQALARLSPSNEFAPYFRFIQHSLQRWPYTSPWTDIHGIMEVFDRVLGYKYSESKILRRISLVPRTNDISFNITIRPTSESDTLEGETKSMTADRLTEKVPARADTTLTPDTKALRTDLLLLMSAIAKEYPYPRNVRIMLILWNYCVLQGIPDIHDIHERLNTTLLQLSFRQQLRVLGGDIYKRLSYLKYENFAFIRNHFGPEFAVKRLEHLGLADYGTMIRKLPWRGFKFYNDVSLQGIGMTDERARNLFLDDMSTLYRDLQVIRKQEKSQCQRRIVTKEGIWYLRSEAIDKSGSLRKIPFEYWEPESKQKATQKIQAGYGRAKTVKRRGSTA